MHPAPRYMKLDLTIFSASLTERFFFIIISHTLIIVEGDFVWRIALACPAEIFLSIKLFLISNGSFSNLKELEIVTLFLPTAFAIDS